MAESFPLPLQRSPTPFKGRGQGENIRDPQDHTPLGKGENYFRSNLRCSQDPGVWGEPRRAPHGLKMVNVKIRNFTFVLIMIATFTIFKLLEALQALHGAHHIPEPDSASN